jgi:hypothetical protein
VNPFTGGTTRISELAIKKSVKTDCWEKLVISNIDCDGESFSIDAQKLIHALLNFVVVFEIFCTAGLL